MPGWRSVLIAVASARMLPGALKLCDGRQMALMGVSAGVAAPIGGWILVSLDLDLMRRLIGVMVVCMTGALATGWRYRGRRRVAATAGVGALSGILNGATSMGGPPAILYVLSGPDSAEINRANLIAFFAIMNVAGMTTLIIADVINWDTVIHACGGTGDVDRYRIGRVGVQICQRCRLSPGCGRHPVRDRHRLHWSANRQRR